MAIVVVLGSCFPLGQGESQDTVLKLGGHILGLHSFTYIKAAAAGTGIAFLADVPALFICLVLVQPLGRTDRQTTILQFHIDLILLKAGQVNVQLIGVFGLSYVGFHQVLGVFPIQGIAAGQRREQIKITAKEIIEQIFSKNTGHHKSFLHSYS